MSPASKSKSKDKKVGKEPQKASSKPPGAANAGSIIPASAYNPLSGTFHALEAVPTSSASPLHSNCRFRNIDEADDHSGGAEYDSVSNNDSWSGESEDHKEKTSSLPLRQETIPGVDNDKREKIRQKNERKHQRQKERRAQELHERCNGYLMSGKLEALAQQLVAMGFQHERATMALILNEGKVEESVSWLFEGGEDAYNHQEQNFSGGYLKIDISEELARITDMELRYNCTRQEVERAIVASEGDLEKAAESLRDLKLDPTSAPPKPEETGDPPTASNGKLPIGAGPNLVRQQQQQQQQLKPNQSYMLQQRRDDKDFNYTKTAVPIAASPESSGKNQQPLKKTQPKLEWVKPQKNTVATDKRWPNAGSNPSVSYSSASPLHVSPSPTKTEPQFVASGSDYKSILPGTVREPVIVIQRPQSESTKQVAATSLSSSPAITGSLYPPSNIDGLKSSGLMHYVPTARSLSPNDLNSNQMFHQLHHQQHQPIMPGDSPEDSPGATRGNGIWSRTAASHTLAAASSLGLFSGLGGSTCSSGSSSPVDWSTASSMAQLDYNSIDWSLDRGSPRPGGLWIGLGSLKKGSQIYDLGTTGSGAKMVMRSAANGRGEYTPGVQEGGVNTKTGGTGSQEWTSPFEGKDLFTLPRQFVSSPSL